MHKYKIEGFRRSQIQNDDDESSSVVLLKYSALHGSSEFLNIDVKPNFSAKETVRPAVKAPCVTAAFESKSKTNSDEEKYPTASRSTSSSSRSNSIPLSRTESCNDKPEENVTVVNDLVACPVEKQNLCASDEVDPASSKAGETPKAEESPIIILIKCPDDEKSRNSEIQNKPAEDEASSAPEKVTEKEELKANENEIEKEEISQVIKQVCATEMESIESPNNTSPSDVENSNSENNEGGNRENPEPELEATNGDADILIAEPEPELIEPAPPQDECLSHGIAFAIDHIRESILSSLDRSTIFNCRLVCRSWGFWVSKQLHKAITLEFDLPDGVQASKLSSSFFYFRQNPRRSLLDVSILMNESANFPCTSFVFHDTKKNNYNISPFPQTFLDAHGAHLKRVEVFGIDCSKWCAPPNPCPTFVEHVKRLLLIQAPNLDLLTLRFPVDSFKPKPEKLISDLQSDSDLVLQIAYDDDGPFSEISMPSLKFTMRSSKLTHNFPKKFLKEMLEIKSSNLSRDLNHVENINSLVRVVSRLHLPQIMAFDIFDKTLDTFEFLSNYCQGKLIFVRELELYNKYNFNLPSHHWSRASIAMTKVLEASSGSCEKLSWHQMHFLNGFKIPKMPKVTELIITFYIINTCRFSSSNDVFRVDINFRETFPNLKSVVFLIEQQKGDETVWNRRRHYNRVVEGYSVDQLFLNFEPVPSVSDVVSRHFRTLNITVLERFKEMFPNAVMHARENYML